MSLANKLQKNNKKSSRDLFDLARFSQGEMTLICVPLLDEVAFSGNQC